MYNRRVCVPGMHVEARGGLCGAGSPFHLHVALGITLVWLARLVWQAFSLGTVAPRKCLPPTCFLVSKMVAMECWSPPPLVVTQAMHLADGTGGEAAPLGTGHGRLCLLV